MDFVDIIKNFKKGEDDPRASFLCKSDCSNEYSSTNLGFAFSITENAAKTLADLCDWLNREVDKLGVKSVSLRVPPGMSLETFDYGDMEELEEADNNDLFDTSPEDMENLPEPDDKGMRDLQVYGSGTVAIRLCSKYCDDVYLSEISARELLRRTRERLGLEEEEGQGPRP